MYQLSVAHEVALPSKGDFKIDGKYLFESGGRKKSFEQIKDEGKSYLAIDSVETGNGNRIPSLAFRLHRTEHLCPKSGFRMNCIQTETGCNYRKDEWLLCFLEGDLVGDTVVGDDAEGVLVCLHADGRESPYNAAGFT